MRRQMALVPVLALSSMTGVLAQTQDEQQACTNDAFQFCQYAIPDRERVFHCLVDNRTLISPACHNVMAAYFPPEPAPVVRVKKPSPRASSIKDTKSAKPEKGSPLKITPP